VRRGGFMVGWLGVEFVRVDIVVHRSGGESVDAILV
jgi:hypothetical protein